MTRVDRQDCCCDMEWYGVDKQGNIAVFCSAGIGNLPEFVCENAERADELMDYFEDAEKNTDSILLFKMTDAEEKCARNFSDKGLYYFDSDDGTKVGIATLHKYYTKQSFPKKPLKYDALSSHIQDILKYNFMEVENFSLESQINVKHAYK